MIAEFVNLRLGYLITNYALRIYELCNIQIKKILFLVTIYLVRSEKHIKEKIFKQKVRFEFNKI